MNATQPRAPVVLAALTVAFFWAVEGIDVNKPQIERVAILLTAIVLAWVAIRGSRQAAGGTAYLAILVAISERLRRDLYRLAGKLVASPTPSPDVD